MTNKKKLCTGCNEEQYIWKREGKDLYCKYCWQQKAPTKINAVSTKKQQEDKVYSKLRKDYLLQHPFCQAALPGCSKVATDVHHKAGRGKYYLITTTWIGLCRSCHTYVEEHPADAKELGFSTNRI